MQSFTEGSLGRVTVFNTICKQHGHQLCMYSIIIMFVKMYGSHRFETTPWTNTACKGSKTVGHLPREFSLRAVFSCKWWRDQCWSDLVFLLFDPSYNPVLLLPLILPWSIYPNYALESKVSYMYNKPHPWFWAQYCGKKVWLIQKFLR